MSITLPTEVKYNVLGKATQIIADLAKVQQFITADDVNDALLNLGYFQDEIGNKAGSFFKGNWGNWVVRRVPGLTVRSRRAARKGGLIGVYESIGYTGVRTPHTTFVNRYNVRGATA